MIHESDDLDHIPRAVYTIGTGRLIERIRDRLAAFSSRSTGLRFELCYVNPEPGEALSLAKRSYAVGIPASWVEATLEEALRRASDECAPIVVAVNHQPRLIERILRSNLGEHPLFVYAVLDLPGEGLAAWQCVLLPEDWEVTEKLADVFGRLDLLTATSRQQAVFGHDYPTADRILEDRCYIAFADHLERNISNVFDGLDPETARAEVIVDGRDIRPLVVLDSNDGWRTGEDVLTGLLASLPGPARPGTNFAIAELGKAGVRFHRARLRATDGRLVLLRTPRRYQGAALRSEAVPKLHKLLRLLRTEIVSF